MCEIVPFFTAGKEAKIQQKYSKNKFLSHRKA